MTKLRKPDDIVKVQVYGVRSRKKVKLGRITCRFDAVKTHCRKCLEYNPFHETATSFAVVAVNGKRCRPEVISL